MPSQDSQMWKQCQFNWLIALSIGHTYAGPTINTPATQLVIEKLDIASQPTPHPPDNGFSSPSLLNLASQREALCFLWTQNKLIISLG